MSPRAFVIGNAAWDEILHVVALPEEGASIHARPGATGPGGKGANQAVVLARAGIPTRLTAVVGADARGDRLTAALAVEGLADGLIRRPVATDWSAILLTDAGASAILTTREAAAALAPDAAAAALSAAVPGDLCLLQGNLSAAVTAASIARARALGLVVALNPSPVDPGFASLLGRADILCLNRSEAAAFAGADFGGAQVVETLGVEGVRLAGGVHVPAISVKAVDPTGAGDSFLAAALAHAAPRGWRLDAAALRAGVRAAAVAVSRPGAFAALPDRETLAAIIGA